MNLLWCLFAGTGLEVHGTKGSIFAKGVMTQQSVGDIELVTEQGREAVPVTPHNLYEHSLKKFAAAVQGEGTPAVTGEDGIKSLAIALAVTRSAAEGTRVNVVYPNSKC